MSSVCVYEYVCLYRLYIAWVAVPHIAIHLYKTKQRAPISASAQLDISPVNLINFLTNPRTKKKCETKPIKANKCKALGFEIVRFAQRILVNAILCIAVRVVLLSCVVALGIDCSKRLIADQMNVRKGNDLKTYKAILASFIIRFLAVSIA